MAGTPAGGKKAAVTNRQKQGADFYARIGKKGGAVPTTKPKGFAANPQLASTAGKKGGTKSRRTGVKNKTSYTLHATYHTTIDDVMEQAKKPSIFKKFLRRV